MSYIPLTVPEGDDPFYEIKAVERQPDGTTAPFDLTGGTITMRIKATRNTPDGSALGSFSGTIVPPAVDGNFTVQVLNSVTTASGDFWYTIKWVAASKQQTLQFGEWYVVNT